MKKLYKTVDKVLFSDLPSAKLVKRRGKRLFLNTKITMSAFALLILSLTTFAQEQLHISQTTANASYDAQYTSQSFVPTISGRITKIQVKVNTNYTVNPTAIRTLEVGIAEIGPVQPYITNTQVYNHVVPVGRKDTIPPGLNQTRTIFFDKDSANLISVTAGTTYGIGFDNVVASEMKLQYQDADNPYTSGSYKASSPYSYPEYINVADADLWFKVYIVPFMTIDSFQHQMVSCGGGSDGSITPFVSKGLAPYTYSWSKDGVVVSSDSVLSGVPAGDYRLIVHDASTVVSMKDTLLFTITQPDSIITNLSAASCYALGYNLNGIHYATSGNYEQGFTANNGCDSFVRLALSTTDEVTMNDPANINICYNGSVPTINFTSADGPIGTYSWTNDNPSIGLAANGIGAISSFTPPVNNSDTDVVANITVTPYKTGDSLIVDTFFYTGNAQTFVVPEGTNFIEIEAVGGAGADGNDYTYAMVSPPVLVKGYGGKGAKVKGKYIVTPGETLTIHAGGKGDYGTGGWNGGGNGIGGPSYQKSGGGGGASDVRRGGTTVADRMIVAGGGGGGGSKGNQYNAYELYFNINTNSGKGGNGGNANANGSDGAGYWKGSSSCGTIGGAYGAMGMTGGSYSNTGYTSGEFVNGQAGGDGNSLGEGGDALNSFSGNGVGGGGGGGYIGGGAGGSSSTDTNISCGNGTSGTSGGGGGGAGGTNFVGTGFNTSIDTNFNTNNGYVIFRYSCPGTPQTFTITQRATVSTTNAQNVTVCYPTTSYTWNGSTYSTSGTYFSDTFNSSIGCDSVAVLNLTITPLDTFTVINKVICGNSYTWNGNTYTADGTYADTFDKANGCDSIVRLVLDLGPPTLAAPTTTILCSNDDFAGYTFPTGNVGYIWTVSDSSFGLVGSGMGDIPTATLSANMDTANSRSATYTITPYKLLEATTYISDTSYFAYTGGVQDFVVPPFTTSVTIIAKGGKGAAGGDASSTCVGGPGGKGSMVQATYPVTPGETLKVRVGGKANGKIGGYNGGGTGGENNNGIQAGGGGGASDVRKGGDAVSNRIIVAAGGGGGGTGGSNWWSSAVGNNLNGGYGGNANQYGDSGTYAFSGVYTPGGRGGQIPSGGLWPAVGCPDFTHSNGGNGTSAGVGGNGGGASGLIGVGGGGGGGYVGGGAGSSGDVGASCSAGGGYAGSPGGGGAGGSYYYGTGSDVAIDTAASTDHGMVTIIYQRLADPDTCWGDAVNYTLTQKKRKYSFEQISGCDSVVVGGVTYYASTSSTMTYTTTDGCDSFHESLITILPKPANPGFDISNAEPCVGNTVIVKIPEPFDASANPVSTDFPTGYCIGVSSDIDDEQISSVSINGVTNNSSNSCDTNYTNYVNVIAPIDITIGQPFPVAVRVSDCEGVDFYQSQVHVYADLNADGVFDTASERLSMSDWISTTGAAPAGDAVFNFNLTIPTTSVIGKTVLRIVNSEDIITNACTEVSYGEKEDYPINITTGGCPTCNFTWSATGGSVTMTSGDSTAFTPTDTTSKLKVTVSNPSYTCNAQYIAPITPVNQKYADTAIVACGSYTYGDSTFTTPGIKEYLLPISAVGGCDSILRIDLTFDIPPAPYGLTLGLPLALTGFNHDIVANGSPLASSITSSVGGNDAFLDNTVTGVGTINKSLPTSGSFYSLVTPTVKYQLQSYSANNSLTLIGGQSGTLTLTTPVATPYLFVLATASGGNQYAHFTINYSDGSSETFSNNNIPDWFNNVNAAIQGVGRINTVTGAMDQNYASATNPRLYQIGVPISPSNQSKTIQSIGVTAPYPWLTNKMHVMAVSYIASIDTQKFCASDTKTLGQLTMNGSDIKWYATPTSTTELDTATITLNNTYYYATQSNATCESARRPVLVKYLPTDTTIVTLAGCNSYTYTGGPSGDITLTQDTIIYKSYVNARGCDSIIKNQILVQQNDTFYTSINTCGDFYEWYGTDLTASGNYFHTLTSLGGCDSIVKLTITLSGTVGNIVMATSADTLPQTASSIINYYSNTCDLITTILASYGDLGLVTSKAVILPTTTTYNSQPFVRRFYDLEATNNVGGQVVLYFTQGEFDDYNATTSTVPDIASDGSNLKVTAYHSDFGSGSAAGYYDTSSVEILTPDSVVWNATDNRWQVYVTTTSFSGFFAHTTSSGAPLAIQLGDISARNIGREHLVTWNTLNESEGDGFELYRSADGVQFDKVIDVPAKGIPSEYSFVDATPFEGVTYYRLRMHQSDQMSMMSKIVSASLNTESFSINAYPNPTDGLISVRIKGAIAGTATIRLIDNLGRILQSKAVEYNNNITTIDLSSLSSGTYYISYDDDRNETTIKVFKK